MMFNDIFQGWKQSITTFKAKCADCVKKMQTDAGLASVMFSSYGLTGLITTRTQSRSRKP